jgi:chromatin segregation and condensation protein Rec8/ScpA/Scc1 (kleisin family)
MMFPVVLFVDWALFTDVAISTTFVALLHLTSCSFIQFMQARPFGKMLCLTYRNRTQNASLSPEKQIKS